jgi:hypothetical protein
MKSIINICGDNNMKISEQELYQYLKTKNKKVTKATASETFKQLNKLETALIGDWLLKNTEKFWKIPYPSKLIDDMIVEHFSRLYWLQSTLAKPIDITSSLCYNDYVDADIYKLFNELALKTDLVDTLSVARFSARCKVAYNEVLNLYPIPEYHITTSEETIRNNRITWLLDKGYPLVINGVIQYSKVTLEDIKSNYRIDRVDISDKRIDIKATWIRII